MKKSKKGLQPLQPLHRICKSLIIFILNDNDSHLFFVFFQKKNLGIRVYPMYDS